MIRKNSLSKLSMLHYETLKIQPYLSSLDMSKKMKILKFKWRTRMVKVSWNYGLKIKCPLCNEENDDQEHLLHCKKLKLESNTQRDENMDQTFLKNLERALRKREILIEKIDKKCAN